MEAGHKRPSIGLDAIVLWLVCGSFLVNWDKLLSITGGLKLWTDSLKAIPIINRFLPVNETLLFDPFRWGMVSIVAGLLIVYTIIDYLSNDSYAPRSYKSKLVIIYVIVTMLVIIPTCAEIITRQQVGTWTHANDNVLITERSIELIMGGRDFYHEDYLNSDLMRFQESYKNPADHPTLFHFIYLPSDTILSIPFYLIIKKALGWYDQRFLYLLLYLLSIIFVSKLSPKGSISLTVAAAFALNPLNVPFIIEGRNDIFTLFWVLLGIILIRQGKRGSGWAAFAVACAHKQFAWFLFPFLLMIDSGAKDLGWNSIKIAVATKKKELAVFATVFAVFIVPFLAWHPKDFFDDVIAYGMGFSKTSMPIEGPRSYGFGTIVLYRAWVRSWNDKFPFWIVQVLTVIPLLYFSLRKTIRENSMASALIGSALVLLVFTYFSRFLHDNYLGYISSIFIVGYGMTKGDMVDGC